MQDCTNRPERLDKLLASSGLVSRSEAKTAVARGRVTVDGISARSPEQKVTRGADIRLDGIPVDTSPFLYIMLNKPAGYVCSTEDGDGRPCSTFWRARTSGADSSLPDVWIRIPSGF